MPVGHYRSRLVDTAASPLFDKVLFVRISPLPVAASIFTNFALKPN